MRSIEPGRIGGGIPSQQTFILVAGNNQEPEQGKAKIKLTVYIQHTIRTEWVDSVIHRITDDTKHRGYCKLMRGFNCSSWSHCVLFSWCTQRIGLTAQGDVEVSAVSNDTELKTDRKLTSED